MGPDFRAGATPWSFLCRAAVFLVLLLVFLEGLFRTILPASQYPRSWQDEEFLVSRFDRTWLAQGTRTIGRLCHRQGKWRINEAGWNSVFDYREKDRDSKPRIAIIGDSYIAGFAVDVDQHVDVRLQEILKGQAEVYSFGVPGAPLSHFIAIARYAEAVFDPDIYLVFVGSGAVLHSEGRQTPYRFCAEREGDGFVLAPPLRVYRPSRVGRLLYRSAIFRYLKINRHFQADPAAGEALGLGAAEDLAGEDLQVDEVALAAFLMQEMRSALPQDEILIFSDAVRSRLYGDEANLAPAKDFRLLEAASLAVPSISLLDLTAAMRADFLENRQPFEDPVDPHWNARGHAVAAQALGRAVLPMLQQEISHER